MTGPEHYAEAERLLATLDDWDAAAEGHGPIMSQLTAEAQVHATLAHAAAAQPSSPATVIHVRADADEATLIAAARKARDRSRSTL